MAADKDKVKAMFKVGECYADGIGVEKDLDKAKHWWMLAANSGHAEAKMKLEELVSN